VKELILAIESAIDTIGVYPQAIIRDGEREERTEWQDGWNACALECIDKVYKHLEIVAQGLDENIAILLLMNMGYMDENEFILNMNDVFHKATADCEVISIEEAKEVVNELKKHGIKGIDQWVASKRGYNSGIT
jgi:hypothetical protein